ncbi:MAG: lipoprotein-releasing ABC transporter permease subunit [Pseudomonadota bacterium]
MFTPLELLLGWRYTRAERRGGFLSFLAVIAMSGVALGIVALITILSIMNGFEFELRDRLLGLAPHISVRAPSAVLSDWQALRQKIETVEEVVSVSPVIEREAMLTHFDQVQGVRLQGVAPKDDPRRARVDEATLGAGLSALKAGEFSIVLGEGLAGAVQARVGDFVTIVSSKPIRTPAGLIPRLKRFQVIGVLGAGVQEFDTAFAFIHIEDAAKLFRYSNAVSNLQIRLDDALAATQIKSKLQPLIETNTAQNLRVYDWTDDNENLFKALKTEKIVMFVVLALAIAVAAFNLLSTLSMLVADKRAEIAILRTLGMGKWRIVLAFFTHGGLIGAIGVSVGTLAGIFLATRIANIVAWLENALGFKVLAPDIYYISDIPSKIEYSDVSGALLVSLALCLLAPLYPAYSASRIQPAQVLRYE